VIVFIGFVVVFVVLMAVVTKLQAMNPDYWKASSQGAGSFDAQSITSSQVSASLGFHTPSGPVISPTPDALRALPTLRVDDDFYLVQPGDTLGKISKRYGVGLEQVVEANEIADANLLEVGQGLIIPPPVPGGTSPGFKIIPDSELVYSPSSVGFNIEEFIQSQGGYLAGYEEEIGEIKLNGVDIVEWVARNFSVNPRLLLALIEHQGGWVTDPDPPKKSKKYPIGLQNPSKDGLFFQLSWAADELNRGYYLWRVNGIGSWVLGDGTVLLADATVNAGTAGVQNLYTSLYDNQDAWEQAVSEEGLYTTFTEMFGFPFGYSIDPLVTPELTQPNMQLPFENGVDWAFTGGPHGGWGSGSAWAALDFAPANEDVGCIQSDEWVVAVADGLITYADSGLVLQDLDGDGQIQTGWVVMYLHIETRERVESGRYLAAGERIGHPSCEGGVSSGTHVHLARRYNGEWIPADQDMPFLLDRWESVGTGNEYDGFLERSGESIEAYAGLSPENTIQR
jgi:LysM repeat protein